MHFASLAELGHLVFVEPFVRNYVRGSFVDLP